MKLKFLPAQFVQDDAEMMRRALAAGHPREVVEEVLRENAGSEVFLSECGTYQVQRRKAQNGFGLEMVVLSIKRVDREPFHDWRVMQAIKNALVGEECEAIELYPAESRLVDTANQYWLWCFTDPAVRLPVGFFARAVDYSGDMEGTKQRPETTP